ncbi:hypothetical protein [Morganella morganii]|nr:hypothetical protein [Morganella morganii]
MDAQILCAGAIVGGNTHRLHQQHDFIPARRQPEYSFFCHRTG